MRSEASLTITFSSTDSYRAGMISNRSEALRVSTRSDVLA